MKRFFKITRFIHAWGSVTLALLFMVISLTGTFLVWKQEYLKLTLPEARADFSPDPEALSHIAEAIERTIEGDIVSITFASASFPLTYVVMPDNHYAYFDTAGRLVDEWQGNGRFEEWVYDLHHRLLLDNLGLNIVGFAAMAMVLLVLLGAMSWWPYRRGFRLGVLPADASRAQLLKSHRNIGIVLGLPFLLTLVTGIVLVYPGQTEALLLEEMRSTQAYSDAMVQQIDNINGPGTGDWLPAFERSLAVFPGAAIRSAQVPGTFNYYRIIGMQQEGEWNSSGMSRVYIDPDGGYMDIRIDARNLPAIERAFNTVTPLHTGKMDSLPYKLFLTLVGSCVFLVSCFGLTSFVKKYIRH